MRRRTLVYHRRGGAGRDDASSDEEVPPSEAPIYVASGDGREALAGIGFPAGGGAAGGGRPSRRHRSKLDVAPALLIASGPVSSASGLAAAARLRTVFTALLVLNAGATLLLAFDVAQRGLVGPSISPAIPLRDPDAAYPFLPLWSHAGEVVTSPEWDAVLLVGQPRHKLRELQPVSLDASYFAAQIGVTLAVLGLGAAGAAYRSPLGLTAYIVVTILWGVMRGVSGGGAVGAGDSTTVQWTLDPGGAPTLAYLCRVGLDAACVLVAATIRAGLLPSWVWSWRDRGVPW